MSGQWIEDPVTRRWTWDSDAPDGDPSPTLIQNTAPHAAHELGVARQEPAMTQVEPEPSGGSPVFNPYASFGSAETVETAPPADDVNLPQSMAGLDGTQLAICPTCGTGVAASRLRQL